MTGITMSRKDLSRLQILIGVAIVRERYEDFGPTLAAEKLAEVHGLPIGVETLRQRMIDDRVWVRD